MNDKYLDEILQNLTELSLQKETSIKYIFLFGHCSMTLKVVDILHEKGIKVSAILDNSESKKTYTYKGVPVCEPIKIKEIAGRNPKDESIVLIASRFYASMNKQLRELGYDGPIKKLIDFNTFSEYSLTEESIKKMKARELSGEEVLMTLSNRYYGYFKVFFPFNALGDVYLAMSYWYAFAKVRNIEQVVFCVSSKVLANVINLFGNYNVEVFGQKTLDSMIQAIIYTKNPSSFIAHHDRPYIINLHKALYVKRIPIDIMYRCGVYDLPKDTKPMIPYANNVIYSNIESIPKGKSVIFSPYAKSVTALLTSIWADAVDFYSMKGYKCYTNVTGDEKPLEGTEAISPSIFEIKSVVERAGTFIGIRSGLCDVVRETNAKKIALYPDYNYCDTKWKVIDMYWIDQFDYNILATDNIKWEDL